MANAPVIAHDVFARHHPRQQFADCRAVALDKRLAPIAKCKAPGIATTGGAPVRVQLAAQWS